MRRFRRAAVVVLLLMIALFFPLLASPAHRIDEEHFALIQSGMTSAEVEAIFGVPAGNYDWAVADTELFLWVDTLIRIQHIKQPAAVTLGQEEMQLSVVYDAPSIIVQRETIDSTRLTTWISRHGAFYIAMDSNGLVVSKGQWGKTRIEPPWQRWWQKVTAK
jgi:hypothetical protein